MVTARGPVPSTSDPVAEATSNNDAATAQPVGDRLQRVDKSSS
jgi:hypothetical protein